MTTELREALTEAANIIEDLVPWSEGGSDAAADIRRHRDRPDDRVAAINARNSLGSFRRIDAAVQHALDLLA